MKLRSVFFFIVGLLTVRLDAGTGVDTSTVNATVDTTGTAGNVTMTMYRPTPGVLENADATAAVDDPLWVKGASAAMLAAKLGSALPAGGGLVADGVTPLIFRIVASSPPPGGHHYDVKISWALGGPGLLQSAEPLLSYPGSRVSSRQVGVTLTAAEPVAFVVLNPIQSEHVNPYSGWAPGRMIAVLDVRDSTTGGAKGALVFAISRPPVALVHGYNVKDKKWGDDFTPILAADRAPGFVIPVGYGIDKEFNTTGTLWQLAATLDQALRAQINLSPALSQWAWTRYDAVGHSQGGVLLRMLCSELDLTGSGGATVADLGFSPWRAPSNRHRGRFYRVVTIGSPHAGSTLAEMGWQLRRVHKLPFGTKSANIFDVEKDHFIRKDLDKLFQSKFRIGVGSDLETINNALRCDPDARLNLLKTTIYGGHAPGTNGEDDDFWQGQFYGALWLDRATPTVLNSMGQEEVPGVVVAPSGSDGVVDTKNQTAGGGSNHTSTIASPDVSHAVLGESDTKSLAVAVTVRDLLTGPPSYFGTVEFPANLGPWLEDRRVRIGTLAQRIADSLRPESDALYSGGGASFSARSGFGPPPPPSDQTLTFSLQPPAGESPNGPVEWSTTIYGPDGVEPPALTLVTTGTHGVQLALTIPATLQGQVVLSVRFPSTSGKTVIGTPQVVFERLPGTALTGIALDPATVAGQVGAELPLLVHGIYDGNVSMSIFTSPANTVFQSSNAAVATVDGEGRVKLLALGTTTITATHAGTLIATAPVTVLDVLPIVVNPPTIPATVGQSLTFQLSASQAVQSFTMDALPAGLTLDAQSGLIEGVPMTEGRFLAVVTVQNANGTGSKQMEFVIAGVPGAPTDVGLDAAGVNGGKPAGTVVGRLVTVDPNPLDTLTYQLVSGAGGTDNGLFTIAGDTLVTAAVLDGAATSTVSIRVRTTDGSGASFEKALVLPVGTPPAIVRQPDAREVFAGESAIFFVETTGLEPLQYQWKKDGTDVGGATSRIFEVPAAALADAGNYTVAVSNGDGSVTSAAASLVVNLISYGRWASALPSGMASALFEPEADYNADGIVNFLDFAFGVRAGIDSGVGAQPAVSRDAFGYVLTYREANGIAPITYRILKSVDLGAWVEHFPTVGEVTRTNLGTHTGVLVRLLGLSPGVFLKIEVTSE